MKEERLKQINNESVDPYPIEMKEEYFKNKDEWKYFLFAITRKRITDIEATAITSVKISVNEFKITGLGFLTPSEEKGE